MKMYKLIMKYFLHNIIPLDFMIEIKQRNPKPNMKLKYFFEVLILIFSQIKEIINNIDFYLWLKGQDMNYLKKIKKELYS